MTSRLTMLILAGVFKTKAKEEDESFRIGKIQHRKAARQTSENMMRIAQNGFLKVVENVNTFIIVWLFEVKLLSLKIIKKARPATSRIERIMGFQF